MRRVFVVAAALVLAAGSAKADLLTNGGFESGDFTGWSQQGNTGFTFVNGSPNSGAFAAWFGPIGSQGGINQSFASVSGAVGYNISYAMGNDSGTPNSFNASFNGNSLDSGANLGANPYGESSFVAPAGVGATQNIQFDFQHDPAFYRLDDVSVNAIVPEPMSMAIFGGLAVAGIAGVRRRMKKA